MFSIRLRHGRGWLLFLLAAGFVLSTLLPSVLCAQEQHTPGMQTQTAPAAPPQDGGLSPPVDPHAGHQMPGGASRGIPLGVAIAGVLFVVFLVLFMLAQVGHWHRPHPAVLGEIALLLLVYTITAYVVHVRKRPGQSTVWEAMTMDMSSMKPVRGAVPVKTERAQCGPFTAKVTYTGTVVALNDEDIYPRVTGRIVSMPVYVGDEVRPGQLVVRLDDAELSGREREAVAATRAAVQNAAASGEQVSAAEAMGQQKAAAARATAVTIEEASRMAAAARARIAEAERGLQEARHAAEAAAKEQSMAAARVSSAQAESEAARSGLDSASADLEAAEADLAYWQAEIKRMKALLDQGAASLDEYQAEEAKYRASVAMVKQRQAMVSERKSMLNSALNKIREAQANAERAGAQVAAAEATADRMAAAVTTAQADYDAALTRIEQARASSRAAQEEVNSSAAQVRAAEAQRRAMNAMAAQSAAALSVARTVRGYTEIRATSPARVVQRLVSPGTVVSPGTLLLRLAQVDRVRLQAYVSAADVANIHVGSRVWASSMSDPEQQVVASVTSISPSSDPATRTSVVEALVDNPRRQFLPGQAVRLQIETANLPRAVTVPSSAVVTRQSVSSTTTTASYAVWTVALQSTNSSTIYTCVMHPEVQEKKPGSCPKCNMPLTAQTTGGAKVAHLVDVTIGPSDGQRTQILSGVSAGQEIVTRGTENLREGQAIQNVPWGEQGPLQLPAPSVSHAPAASTGGGGGMENMPGMNHQGQGK